MANLIDLLKRTVIFIFPVIFLSGCLEYDKMVWSIDLINNEATIIFSDIRSVPDSGSGEQDIEKDFKELLLSLDGACKKGLKEVSGDACLGEGLFESENQLNWKVTIKFASLDKMLAGLKLIVDKDGSYIYHGVGSRNTSRNGIIKLTPDGPILWWPKETTSIEIVKHEGPYENSQSLLKQWLSWQSKQKTDIAK